MTDPERVFEEHHPEIVYLKRIADDMKIIRQQNTELLKFYRSAESEVPESLRRFANYFHDLHDIKYMYEEHGTTPPKHVLQEIERLDDRYRQILKEHNTDGGAIEKIRREMAADPDNRYDHKQQLTFKGSHT
jgi:hypothetical protein